jgi:prepilin-type N-terminal cleavage/methylation domain-containing protein
MRRRSGFTLVELLVAMALIVFVMMILSEAFTTSMASFRTLKAVGDMDARLRNVATVLRDDLSADHFEGKKRLSDPNFWRDGPPREGFFRLWHGSACSSTPGARYYQESDDAPGDGIPSRRAVDHMLHFTVKKRGNGPGDYFGAQVPGNSPLLAFNPNYFGQPPGARYQDVPNRVTSQWAEVAYFLRPNGASANGIPLFALYRRQLLVLPNNLDLNWGQKPFPLPADPSNGVQPYGDFSAKPTGSPGGIYFNSPSDLTVPERRFGMLNTPGGVPGDNGPGYPTYPTIENNPNP